jgi:hypothetical protein
MLGSDLMEQMNIFELINQEQEINDETLLEFIRNTYPQFKIEISNGRFRTLFLTDKKIMKSKYDYIAVTIHEYPKRISVKFICDKGGYSGFDSYTFSQVKKSIDSKIEIFKRRYQIKRKHTHVF